MHIEVLRGLNIAIDGAPRQVVTCDKSVTSIAILGADYRDVRVTLSVEVGDRVIAGQTVFVDRRRPEIAFTAPRAGTVSAIHRGRRRSLDALVIDLDGDGSEVFGSLSGKPEREDICRLLCRAGIWPSFLTRPFGRVPDPNIVPHAIFVTAMDTNPLAADAAVVLASEKETFRCGLDVLTKLTDGPTFVCQAPGPALANEDGDRIRCVRVGGPHPAGLPGTHIHKLAPAGGGRMVWHIGYQDVIAIGHLVTTGTLLSERVISLAGPGVRDPRLVRTVMGASLDDIVVGELTDGEFRVVSGSVLSGREAGFLGRYHTQVSVVPVPPVSEPSRISRLFGGDGEMPRPVIPVEALERVMALDILPVPLLRALSAGDVETAERLGCRELVEEDVALLSYVCASNADYGALLRSVLDELEEGS